jgi:hypothetical protein
MDPFKPGKVWDVAACFELFCEAVETRQRALLRGVVDGVIHEHQIRFRQQHVEGKFRGVWVEFLGGDTRALKMEYRNRSAVEVSFSVHAAMAFFDTLIEQHKRTFWMERRLLLRAPNQICVVQQRKDGRVWVPDDALINTRLSRLSVPDADDHDARSATIIPGRICDLSASGASFICPLDPMLAALKQGEKLDLQMDYSGARVSRAAAVCYARPLSMRSARLGIQFIKDPANAESSDEPDLRRIIQELESFNARVRLYESSMGKDRLAAS